MTKKKIEIDYWQEYVGKRVRLIIEDFNSYPKPRDGVFVGSDTTHVFLKVFNSDIPKPFLKSTIKRIDIFEQGATEI